MPLMRIRVRITLTLG